MATDATLPQAFLSNYAPRLRVYNNSLLTPSFPAAPAPLSRTTKRGTTIINYAEDGYDVLDDDDSDPRRRTARGLRRGVGSGLGGADDASNRPDYTDRVGKEAVRPVTSTQGIWRDWMHKQMFNRSDQQNAAQASLPLTLIPIRIDLDIPAYVPQAAVPVALPPNTPLPPPELQHSQLAPFRQGELTPPYKLRDVFLWNLHETLITTDQFARCLVQDLDLPNAQAIAAEISRQIRTQLEEYAGVALHPLFHSQHHQQQQQQSQNTASGSAAAATRTGRQSRGDTPLTTTTNNNNNAPSSGGPSTPLPPPPSSISPPPPPPAPTTPQVNATATSIPPGSQDYNPDDTYRCILNLSLNLSSTLYTDKFEWSLIHPPGVAEAFARQTCADLGLAGEWAPAMTHAIYEAVLRLKKEACESGGLVLGWGADMLPGDMAVGPPGARATAGVRYDADHLGSSWEPAVELLSKEDMERREGDRERQIRRLRRDTARFSSTAGLVGGVPFAGFGPLDTAATTAGDDERMGRGERHKKRSRRLSPRAGTPAGRGTPDAWASTPGYGGNAGSLADAERAVWRCAHCRVPGTCVWAVRDGPAAPRSLCNNCGLVWERDRRLPASMRNLHNYEQR